MYTGVWCSNIKLYTRLGAAICTGLSLDPIAIYKANVKMMMSNVDG